MMIQFIKLKFTQHKSYFLFVIWLISVVILLGMLWNNYRLNIEQEADLLTEIQKSNISMKITEEFRPKWTKMLNDLEVRQQEIVVEIDNLHKMKELSLKYQLEIIDKLDRLSK